MVIVNIGLSHFGTSTNTFLNHYVSSLADDKEMNLDSIEELVKNVFLLNF